MKFFEDRPEDGKDLLWVFPVMVPVFLLLCIFLLQPWYWGLMDDAAFLGLKGNIFQKAWAYFLSLKDFGEWRPTLALHAAWFYTVFHASPKTAFLVKSVEVYAMMAVWGTFAARLSNRALAGWVCAAAMLCFHYLYDAFFFLSTQEILGLIFCGLAGHLVWDILRADQKGMGWKIPALAALLMAGFGAKEPFIACGVAYGVWFLWEGRRRPERRRSLWVWGILLVLFSGGYGVLLKVLLQKGYTAGYSFTDTGRILGNLQLWARKDLLNHLPWLLISWGCWRGGAIPGVLLYGAYLTLLLPWNTLSYYAGPLGVFFGLTVAGPVVRAWDSWSIRQSFVVVLCATMLNVFVCSYAALRESAYNGDTIQLISWLKDNRAFRLSMNAGQSACSNAMEGGQAVPQHLARDFGVSFKGFYWVPGIDGAMRDERCSWYVFTPRFGTLNSSDTRHWSPEFVSRYWTVYRKVN